MNTRIIACCTAAIFTGISLFAEMPCQQKNKSEFPERKPQSGCMFCAEAEEIFPEDAAKVAQLRKTAMESQRALMEKVMQKRKSEMETARKLAKACRESPTEANLAELKKWVSAKIEAKTAFARKKLEKTKAELASIEKLGISPQKMEQIRRLYDADCRRAETFLNADKEDLTEKIMKRMISAEPKHTVRQHEMKQGDRRTSDRNNGRPSRPERDFQQEPNPFEE